MSDKPEALRLADALTECHHIGVGGPDLQAAAELRRQHAEIESLKAECDALRALLRYWLPDETMIPTGHEAKWNESVASIDAAREAGK